MKNTTLKTAMIALTLLLAAAPAFAQDKPAAPGAASAKAAKKETKAVKPAKLADINSASKAELKKLPGVGEAEADKIIAGRPYRSKAELATKKILPTGIYLQIKGRIIARQKPEPAPRAAGK